MVDRIIFENGIEVGSSPNCVKVLENGDSLATIYAQVMEIYHVRPVLLTNTTELYRDTSCENKRHWVIALNSRESLHHHISSIVPPKEVYDGENVSLLWPILNMQYIAGALVYHCQELSLLYHDICNFAFRIHQMIPRKDRTFLLQGQSEAYYEFDALITAARRTYDSLRYILWNIFGSNRDSVPRNFPKTLELCDKIPEVLRNRLFKSWSDHGKKLTDYRDCIQHYVNVSFGIESALLRQDDGGTWSVLLRIPDNPEVKSKQHFEYIYDLDALTYGWELANELIGITLSVLAAIPATKDGSGCDRDCSR